MHDKNGNLISAGDRIILTGTIREITSDQPTYCNITVITDETMAPEQTDGTALALSARQVERVQRDSDIEVSDRQTILNKTWRRDIDELIQRIRAASDHAKPGDDTTRNRRSEWRDEARQHLQYAVMCLGMDLKAINEENPPHEDAIEAEAKAIYEVKHSVDDEGRTRSWVPGGNSLKQDEARREAREKLSRLPNPYPSSKDPATGGTIEPTADNLKL